MKLPFLQFYIADYLRDTRALSLAAKGGWVDVLCMLHGCPTRGTMALPLVGWARVMGASEAEAAAVIAEIEAMQVADVSRNGNGLVTLESRRMKRDEITKEQTRQRVKRHRLKEGRPDDVAAPNPQGNGASNASETGQKTEIRNQKSEEASPLSQPPAGDASEDEPLKPLLPPADPPAPNPPIPFVEVMALFNSMCPTMPRATITDLRRKSIRARWLECKRVGDVPLTWFASLFGKAHASDFLSGRHADGKRTWRCTFDWLIGPKNAPKVIEGNYDNRSTGGGNQPWKIQ